MASPMTTGYEFYGPRELACNLRNILILYQMTVSCQSGSTKQLSEIKVEALVVRPVRCIWFTLFNNAPKRPTPFVIKEGV